MSCDSVAASERIVTLSRGEIVAGRLRLGDVLEMDGYGVVEVVGLVLHRGANVDAATSVPALHDLSPVQK